MSSVPEKSKLIREKRSFFMRSGSFEKLKCSAKYPLQLVGVKLSKMSVIELAESIIVKSRLLSQRLLLVLFIILYKAICAILSILVRTSANPLSVVAVCDKQDKEDKDNTLPFYQRLQVKVEKLQRHKKRLDSLKSSDVFRSASLVTTTTTKTITETERLSKKIEENNRKILEQQRIERTTTCCTATTVKSENKEYGFHAELKRLREYSTEKEILPSLASESNKNTNIFELICLYPLVYGSILVMLCQLYILGNVLNSTAISLGYVFLIGSLGVIAVITFQVFFKRNFQKTKICSTKRLTSELTINEEHKIIEKHPQANSNLLQLEESIKSSIEITSNRQSRTRLKKNIDLSSKTLSKIKLL